MAVPAIPTVVASRAPRKELGFQDTMLATGDPDDIEIELAESGLGSPRAAAVATSRARRTSRTPTFDTLSVVAVPRFRWAYVTGAVIAASVATWLALA